IQAFHDMPLAPAPVELVSNAIGALMQDRLTGIYQLTGPRDVSYAEIGRFLAARLGADPMLVAETSALAAGLPEGATPRHTTLDWSALSEPYGLAVPDVGAITEPMIAAKAENR